MRKLHDRLLAALLAAGLLAAPGCAPSAGPVAPEATPAPVEDLPPAAERTGETPAPTATPTPTASALPETFDIDGVRVDREDTELDLNDHDLPAAGVSPEELEDILSRMPNLERVELRRCGYTNDQLAALQDALPEIKLVWEIALSHWTIPTDAVAFSTMKTCADTFFLGNDEARYLKYCTDLVALDLGHNHVTDISFLRYMPQLKILILVDNSLPDWSGRLNDLSVLQYTPKLEYLEFFVCSVTDLSFLRYTPNLIDLNISYNPIQDAQPLFGLPKLERLLMEHTRIPYGDFLKLRAAYPNAQVEYAGQGSIDHGWRTHPRYYAMRDMFDKNYVHPYFADGDQRQTPPAWKPPYQPPATPSPAGEELPGDVDQLPQEALWPEADAPEAAWSEPAWSEPAWPEPAPEVPADAVADTVADTVTDTPADVPGDVPTGEPPAPEAPGEATAPEAPGDSAGGEAPAPEAAPVPAPEQGAGE